jgi:hypothetical protein
VKGIDRAANASAQKENATLPKVTLSFELTRSGLVQLNKAEAKFEETYYVDERASSKSKTSKNQTDNETTDASNNGTEGEESVSDDSAP